MAVLRNVSWGVLPLVAGLFVLVEALEQTGRDPARSRPCSAASCGTRRRWPAGSPAALLGFACNLVNNLPAGLLAGRVVAARRMCPKPCAPPC